MSLPESLHEPLSAIELRILGCLLEKQATTPETYPLTLNALLLACNQKTAREPLMNLQEGSLGQALRSLEGRGLVRLQMGGRADRWEHRLDKALELIRPQLAILALLFLRGPQTAGELLARSTRLHEFDDLDELRHQLERLQERRLVQQLERQSGQREERYMHSLGRSEDLQALLEARPAASSGSTADDGRLAALEARIEALEARLVQLEARP